MDQQSSIFDAFYGLQDYNRQKDYICTHVTQKNTVTILDEETMTPKKKTRQVARKFFLTVDGEKVQVCKRFFLGTLSVGHAYVQHALGNAQDGVFSGQDGRGKHTPGNKTSEEDRRRVRKHIESFPCLESHYCRKSSGRKFLDETLSIKEMYRLFTQDCASEGVVPVSSSIYRQTFVTEYNLAFHKPKKDLCLLCSLYHDAQKNNTVTPELEADYREHQEKKQESRQEKTNDKKLAQENNEISVATFDLESVLSTPCNNISQTHYKRKLAVYNLSIYNLASKEGQCFVWDETHGRKGSCEIATCLFHHLKCLPPQVKHVILYSDTCTGQNRNQYVAAALLQAVQQLPNLECIDQKFLTSGHTHMECDSMHSAIETAKKKIQVAIPDQWHYVIECARLSQPYTVHELEFGDFIDYKKVAASTMRNTKTDAAGNRINWLQISWFRFKKEDPDTVFFKYRMKDDFQQLKIRGGRRGRTPCMTTELPSRYLERQPISAVKKADLMDLCRLNVIPQKHHHFYEGLPCSLSAPDRLPEPDITEDVDTDEG
ncbi:hypothetical protein V1264_017700 [Littorina saxatilis]|uniref:DUF7869 domain-containing protein n=1 Tax=Littorina saxatilis TaxID=31220 RepID=A0AAN9GG09_9CAEN